MLDLNSLFSGLLGAVAGGLITWVSSRLAVKETGKQTQRLQAANDARTLRGLLQVLHDELESVQERYQETMGKEVESLQDGQPLLFVFPVTNDYFAVYNGNASQIGRIENNDLRKSLVQTYVLAKGLVDSFKLNNEYLSKYEHWSMIAGTTKLPLHQQNADNYYRELTNYARRIKKSHETTKTSIKDLLRRLHKQGVLNEAGD